MQLQKSDIALLEIRAELEKAKAIVERRREYSRRYYERHKQVVSERNARWHRKNPNYIADYMKRYRKGQKQKIAALERLVVLRELDSLTIDRVKEVLSPF